MLRRGLDQTRERIAAHDAVAAHAVERLGYRMSGAERQTRDYSTAGEDVGISSEHHRGHRATRRQAGDEDAGRIGSVAELHRVHHFADRQRFATSPSRVLRLVPVEAEVRVVGPLLFREQDGEAVFIGGSGPARAMVVATRALSTAVKHDHQRSAFGQVLWDMRPGSEFDRDWSQTPGRARGGCRWTRSSRTGAVEAR